MSITNIKEVAKFAGVSPATVSRVMNGTIAGDSVLGEKVLKAVRELKYYPNHIARALRTNAPYGPSFFERTSVQRDAKKAIAKAAWEKVSDEPILYIEAGTTTMALVEHLREYKGEIYTNSLPIVTELMHVPNLRIHIWGGDVIPDVAATVGPTTVDAMKRSPKGVGLLTASGLDERKGLTCFNPNSVFLKRTLIEISLKTYVLADHTKWDRQCTRHVASISEIDEFITDDRTSVEHIEWVRSQGVVVTVVPVSNLDSRG
ncbi:LacI family DNA-binding transcriptional regulator [Alicyclobacillus tolerans]|uniref:DeoR/GlpR family DNA-binding transcription regulator n=1 Tax=Alicyclobacillus tolerans TaxID=90970 RepID=UPI001F03070B|nr:LacI family DNA-binding transcriptional regulator [Alicyclobacillus tolerans]MCF8567999.1 LacI family DNA-binding transcriptional regulator [Alicyclobacillus tolerans]